MNMIIVDVRMSDIATLLVSGLRFGPVFVPVAGELANTASSAMILLEIGRFDRFSRNHNAKLNPFPVTFISLCRL